MSEAIHPTYEEPVRQPLPSPGANIGQNASRLVGHVGAILAVMPRRGGYFYDPYLRIRDAGVVHFVWVERKPFAPPHFAYSRVIDNGWVRLEFHGQHGEIGEFYDKEVADAA